MIIEGDNIMKRLLFLSLFILTGCIITAYGATSFKLSVLFYGTFASLQCPSYTPGANSNVTCPRGGSFSKHTRGFLFLKNLPNSATCTIVTSPPKEISMILYCPCGNIYIDKNGKALPSSQCPYSQTGTSIVIKPQW